MWVNSNAQADFVKSFEGLEDNKVLLLRPGKKVRYLIQDAYDEESVLQVLNRLSAGEVQVKVAQNMGDLKDVVPEGEQTKKDL
jgi:hypothetical protein